MKRNTEKLDRRSNTFSSFAWPDEFGDKYQGEINREKNDEDKMKQKLNSLCRRSFLTADTEEERNFLSRVCDENDEDENKGNEILYDEVSSTGGGNVIKRLPRLPSGYGHHFGGERLAEFSS